jgi:prepilin-type processing-associated H-X9-DG protein
MRKLALTLVLVMCLAAPAVASPPPLADRLPAETKAYLGWSGRTMAFEGSLVGQLLGEPSVEKLLGAVRKSVEKSLSAEAQKKAFKHGWAMALTAWQHPAAIALTDIPLLRGGRPAGVPGAILMVDLGKDQPAFQKELDGLIDAVDEEIPVVETRVGEVPCRAIRLGGDGFTIHFGFDETTFFLVTRKDVLATIQAVEADKSLATSKEFTAAMKDVGRENLQMAFYADADWLLRTVAGLPLLSGEKESVSSTLKAAGLSKVTVIAAATSIVDRNMYTRGRLFTPAPHTGLLSVLATDPLSEEDLSGIPADADFAMAANLPLDKLYTETHRFGRAAMTDPNALARAEALVKQAIGLDVKRDLVDAVGDTWVLCSAPSRGGFLTGTSLSVTLKDSRKAAATVDKIEARIRQYARQQADRPRRSPFDIPTIPRLYTRKTPRAEITTCTFHGGLIPAVSGVAPSWTIHKDKLHVALWPQVVQTLVENNGTQTPLTADETFKAYRKRVSAKPVALSWVNTPSLLKQVYNVGMIGWSMGSVQLTRMTGVEFRPGWLPPLGTLQKYLKPSISAVSADADGILMEQYGPLPGTGGELLNTSALTASILLPSLHSARQRAKQTVSMTRLRGVAVAIQIYHNEHNVVPPNPGALVEGGYCGVDQFESPFGSGELTYKRGTGVVGQPDYILVPLPPLDKLDNWKNMVLAYEKPENYGKRGTAVAFADGHVEWLTMKDFKAAMKKTQAAIKGR